jgi:PAS domain S-box-containing protein
VVGVSEAGGFTFETVNPPLGAGTGFLAPDFTGKAPEQCLPPVSADLFRAHFHQVIAASRPLLYEEEHVVEGRSRNFQTILTPVRNKWGRIHRIAAISRDITALREAQAALLASEERLNLALEGTQQSLWDWSLATGEFYRNPRWFSMLNLEPDSLAATMEAGLRQIHPEDRRQVEGAMNAHLEGRQARFQAEYRLRSGSGEWIWVFDAGKVVAWDADGNPARVTGMCTDITERRRAEESLRALVGGVVHEIRNPVYGIFINLDALEATFGEQPRFAPFVSALRESAERISSLMNDLKDYGEPRTLNPEPCLLRGLLEEAARSCEALAAERRCRFAFELEDPLAVLPLNGRRMHQVFRNLLENALHCSPPGGRILTRVRRDHGEGYAWWIFTVEDEGAGFDADTLNRAFEPFFTRRKGGTGLGLSIVKRVVEEHGGTVELGNRPQGGAIITVKLPAPRRQVELIEEENL